MKIDFDAKPRNPKGDVFKGAPTYTDVLDALGEVTNRDPDASIKSMFKAVQNEINKLEGQVQTLADVCYVALVNGKKAVEGTGDEKRALYRIAADLAHGGIVDLAHADKVILVEQLEEHCTAASLVACESLLVAVPTKKAAKKAKKKSSRR